MSTRALQSLNGVWDYRIADGEHYIANVLSEKNDSGKKISELSVKLENEKYNLLIYGVTAE